MRFTFVADCSPCYRLLSTLPHGNAVTGHSRLNDLIYRDESFTHGFWFSGTHPEVFFYAQMNDGDEEVGEDGEKQVMMEAAPAAAFVMVEAEIGLGPLEVLLDVPAGAAE